MVRRGGRAGPETTPAISSPNSTPADRRQFYQVLREQPLVASSARKEQPRRPARHSLEATVMSLAGRLTPAHRRIARLVALGYSNAQIAEELTLSPGTIRNQLSTIYERLGVRRCQLVVLVVRWGWISPEEIAAALDAAPEARG